MVFLVFIVAHEAMWRRRASAGPPRQRLRRIWGSDVRAAVAPCEVGSYTRLYPLENQRKSGEKSLIFMVFNGN